MTCSSARPELDSAVLIFVVGVETGDQRTLNQIANAIKLK